MSFGFPVENPIVQTAIDDAFRKGRILFAATANDGGNGGVAYPAKDPIVIGVNSSNGKGNQSIFSPTTRSNEDNFSIVGEAIESSWYDSNGVWPTPVVKSGTSYATPIAAGLEREFSQFIASL
jgi:subtilisin family serine protease